MSGPINNLPSPGDPWINPEGKMADDCCPATVTVRVVSMRKDPNGGNVWYIDETASQEVEPPFPFLNPDGN